VQRQNITVLLEYKVFRVTDQQKVIVTEGHGDGRKALPLIFLFPY
jgi:hypothetical protein